MREKWGVGPERVQKPRLLQRQALQFFSVGSSTERTSPSVGRFRGFYFPIEVELDGPVHSLFLPVRRLPYTSTLISQYTLARILSGRPPPER